MATVDIRGSSNAPHLGLLSEARLPPVAEDVFETLCARRGLTEPQARESLRRELKIDYLYSGMIVVCERTADDVIIVAVGGDDDERVDAALQAIDNNDPIARNYEVFNVLRITG